MPTNSEFDAVYSDGSKSRERGYGNLAAAGDVFTDNYTNLRGYGYDPINSQFSQDKEGDPIRLLESTRPGIDAHASMNESFGLCQPAATLGSHPFLRDELANPTELEPGNAEPQQGLKIPKRG
jgi:hypothetical protein